MQAIPDHHADQILEDFKIYMQEQLIRKANQKEAIAVRKDLKEDYIQLTFLILGYGRREATTVG